MEAELFDWESWDSIGDGELYFSQITLKKQIGNLLPRTKFDRAFISFQSGHLQFENCNIDGDTTEFIAFKLQLTVVEQLEKSVYEI